MNRWMKRATAGLLLSGVLGLATARADQDPRYDDEYGYSDDQDYGDSDGGYYEDSSYEDGGNYDDADVYYENQYGADNAYDLYFYRTLSSYGEWSLLPGVGYVFRPFTRSGWQPYSVGYWGWSSNNWSWMSYEPFGSITYHYGNWGYLNDYGWCWFPGYQWAPHHVQWSSYDGYVGWSPAPPRLYGRNSYRFSRPDEHCVWISNRDFLSRDVSRHMSRGSDVWRGRGRPRSLPILSGPSRSAAERWTGRVASRVQMQQVNRGTRRGQVQVYVPDRSTREQIRREGGNTARQWLDTKRVEQNSRVRPWQRNRTETNQGGVNSRPWGGNRDNQSEQPRRGTPRVREDRQQSDNPSTRTREPRRSTPWRGYRKPQEEGRSEDRRDNQERRSSEERRGSEGRRGSENRRETNEGRTNNERKQEAKEESNDNSGQSNRKAEERKPRGNQGGAGRVGTRTSGNKSNGRHRP